MLAFRRSTAPLGLCAILLQPRPAVADGTGSAGALFLLEEPTARVFGLGGLSGLSDDPGMLFLNPGGLGASVGWQSSASFWQGLDGVSRYQFASVVAPATRFGAWSAGYLGFDSGSEEIFELDGTSRQVRLETDRIASLGWGRRLTERVFFGGNLKWARSTLADVYTANAFTADAALVLRSLGDRATLSLGAQNLFGELKYRNVGDPLPRVLRAGAGYRFGWGRDSRLMVGVDASKVSDADDLDVSAGVEYNLGIPFFAARAGVRRDTDSTDFTFGAGISAGSVGLDYGFQPAGDLGQPSQRLSLVLRFGPRSDYERALAYADRGMLAKATAMLQGVPEGHKDYRAAQDGMRQMVGRRDYGKALELWRKGEFEKAMATFRSIPKGHPDYENAQARLDEMGGQLIKVQIAYPQDGFSVSEEEWVIGGFALSDYGVTELTLNGQPMTNMVGKSARKKLKAQAKKKGSKAAASTEEPAAVNRIDFQTSVALQYGTNKLIVAARNRLGLSASAAIHIVRKRPETLAAKPALWLVIIGINRYTDPTFPSLKFAQRDAEAVSAYFEEQRALGVYREIQKKVLINDKATLVEVRKALGSFFNDARESDVAIVFIAGHGYQDKHGRPYIVTYDSDVENLYSSALPMDEFRSILKDHIPPKRTLVLADACHSGGIGPGLRGTNDIAAEFMRRTEGAEGRVTFTASREREYSREDETKGHGLFTYYLLEGMRGAGDIDGDGIVTLSEAYDYTYGKVVAASKGAQHPTLPAGGFDNEMPLAAVKR